MAHDVYVRTNQKLYFSSLTLKSWAQAAIEPTADFPAYEKAAREAVLFHLYGAVLSLCHEVGQYYHLAYAKQDSVQQILRAAINADEPSPELIELHELAAQADSWLAQLLSEFARLFHMPVTAKAAKVDPTIALIAVSVDEPEPELELSPVELEQWRQALKATALRFRETMTEY